METTRQQKIGRLIQKELGEYFQIEGRNLGGALITVTRVSVTKDLSIARVFLSIFATQDKKALFNHVKTKSNEIKFHLGRKIKNQVRVIPHLDFFFDESLDYIEKIEKLLNE